MNKKMVCGGVYEWTDTAKRKLQGTLVSVTHYPTGEVCGTLLATGFAPETIKEGTTRWGQMALIGRPASPNVGRPKKKG